MSKARQIAPTEEIIRASLISMASEFGRCTGMSRSAIGLKALNDSNFLFRLEAGEDFRMKSYARIHAFMSRNWPRDRVSHHQRRSQGR